MGIDYEEYMNSPEWQNKRDQVIERSTGVCEACRIKKMQHVHHLTYERFGNELLEDLQGLCLDCHQSRHPNRKLKRDWRLISEICDQLNITVPSLKRVLKRENLMESIVISWGYSGNKKKTNKADVPTIQAHEKKISKQRPGVKSKGRRGPFVWDFDLVKQVLESQEVSLPKKDEYKDKSHLPLFMQIEKPSKSETYNAILDKYGMKTSYNRKLSHWEIEKDGKIVATFSPYSKHGLVSIGDNWGINVRNDFNDVIRVLKEHGLINSDVESAPFSSQDFVIL